MKNYSKNLFTIFSFIIAITILICSPQTAQSFSLFICGPATYTNGSQSQTIPLDCSGTLSLPSGGTLTFNVCASANSIIDMVYLFSGPLPPGATFPPAQGLRTAHSTFTWTQSGPFIGDVVFYGAFLECTIHFDWPLPVELSSFTSLINGNDITLNWQTSSESNNSEFLIERSTVLNGNNSDWSQTGSVQGNGSTTSASDYTFTDRSLSSGVYNYRLKQIDFNGNFEYHYLGNNVQIGLPEKFELSQNYPNPFNPSTVINYNLTNADNISLKVYNSSGIEVKVLDEGFKQAGYYSIRFDGNNLASGIYYYKLVSENFTAVKKMMLVK